MVTSEKEEKLSEELAELQSRRNELKAAWNSEKEMIGKVQQKKEAVDSLRFEAEQAERAGDYGKVAEIRYGKIIQLEKEIAELKDQIDKKRKKGSLIQEEVRSEDIAEIVSKWTGIPVSRMLESEKEKLLRLEDELHKRVVGQDEANKGGCRCSQKIKGRTAGSEKTCGIIHLYRNHGCRENRTCKGTCRIPFQR